MRQGLKNPSIFSNCANCPLEGVSWYDALRFANDLSKKAGLEICYDLTCKGELGEPSFTCSKVSLKRTNCLGYRLPTEAEWEVAARAQAPSAARAQGPSAPYKARYGELDDIAWYNGNSSGKTHAVGGKNVNAWRLRDLLGNVREWTWDLFTATQSSDRVVRGGSWRYEAKDVRAAYRGRREPSFRDDHLGFRLALGQPRSGAKRDAP